MTSWMKERDRLLEQTLTFVQGVTGKRPIETVTQPIPAAAPAAPMLGKDVVDPSSVETEALISMIAMSQAAIAPEMRPPQPIVVADAAQPIRAAAQPPLHQPATRRPAELVLPERDLIAQRVARFRAVQQKTLQDREANYAAVQARIRATLGSDPLA